MRAGGLQWTLSVPGLMLIAQAVLLLERGQDKQTDATDHPTHVSRIPPTAAAATMDWQRATVIFYITA